MKKSSKKWMFSINNNRNILKILMVMKLKAFLLLICIIGLPVRGYSQQEQGRQNFIVTGIVSASTGETLPGVNILVKGTETGTISGMDGKYYIEVPDASSVLIFSYVGYITLEINISGRTLIDVILEESIEAMEEVVVVGYGTQKKANLTGAVDQVSSETFENRTMTNLTQGLLGVMPNLNIVLLDGKPNQAPSYNIRGTTSIGQGGSALVLIDGVEGDPSLINPNDIESVSLLKDAASAAIYGARGVFGVVLITTKSPAKGKTSITFSSGLTIRKPTAVPDFVTDGYTWAKMFAEGYYNWENTFPSAVNKTLRFSQEYLDELKRRSENPDLPRVEINPDNGEYVYYSSTDYYDELYKDYATGNEQNISIAGSTEKTSFLMTGRFFGQEGIFNYNSDDYKLFNFRAKGMVQVFPWLAFDNNMEHSSMSYHNPMNVGESGGIWRNIGDEGHPMSPIFNPDGTLTHSSAYNIGDFWYGKNGTDIRRRVFKNTTGMTAIFFDNRFRIKGNFTFQNTGRDEKRIRVPVPYCKIPDVVVYVGTKYGDIQDIKRETQYLATNFYGEYENIFNEDHYLKAMAGVNYEQSTYRRLLASRNGLLFEDAIDINLALGENIITEGGWERWNILGGFSRINYSYKDKYLIEIDARYDGSSKFPEKTRFALFPSLSAGWRISKESFWKVSDKLISNLKIRGSYGSLGNGNIDSYVYQEQFTIEQSGILINGIKPQYTSRPTVLPEGITWETATTTNIGLDLAFASNKLIFIGDAYIRNTTDMFTIGMTLPAVFGATPPKGNYADLQTRGWEMILSWRDKFNISSKPFYYDLRFTLADNKSVITKYNNPEKFLNDYYEGQVIGEIWGYTSDGFFTSTEDIENHADQSRYNSTSWGEYFPGDIKLKDLNGDDKVDPGTERLDNPGDRSIIGNSAPRYRYGISLGADWNNFFFSAFFQGVGKQDWWPSSEASVFWGQYNRPYNDPPKWHINNHWTPENPDAYLPRYVARLANRDGAILKDNPQTRYLQNIAYLRMKNIQFGYNLPKSLISRIGADNLKIYFSGENLLTWSPLYKYSRDLDVESTGPSDQFLSSSNYGDGYNYPMMKNVTFGLSVTF